MGPKLVQLPSVAAFALLFSGDAGPAQSFFDSLSMFLTVDAEKPPNRKFRDDPPSATSEKYEVLAPVDLFRPTGGTGHAIQPHAVRAN
jgi:hypothetical protein